MTSLAEVAEDLQARSSSAGAVVMARLTGLASGSAERSSYAPLEELTEESLVAELESRRQGQSTFEGTVGLRSAKAKRMFQNVVMGAIVLNMLVLCIETDHGDWPGWKGVNIAFLIFYFSEYALVIFNQFLWHVQLRPHYDLIFDLILLLIGVLDVSLAYSFHKPHGEDLRVARGIEPPVDSSAASEFQARRLRLAAGSHVNIGFARILMLSRLLRLIRFVRLLKDLNDFCILLFKMLKTFVVVLSAISALVFLLAILLTRAIGHGLLVSSDDELVNEEMSKLFKDIPTTAFTLFQLTTAEDWDQIAIPLMTVNSCWRYFFISFITVMSWTMLSLLTAMASECLIVENQKLAEQNENLGDRKEFVGFLMEQFRVADRDESNDLDRDEFEKLISSPVVVDELKKIGIKFNQMEVDRIWERFDLDESGYVDIREVVSGFEQIQESISTNHIANVDLSMKRLAVKVDTTMSKMKEDFGKVEKLQEKACKRITSQLSRNQEAWDNFMKVVSTKVDPPAPPVVEEKPTEANNVTVQESTIREKHSIGEKGRGSGGPMSKENPANRSGKSIMGFANMVFRSSAGARNTRETGTFRVTEKTEK